MKKRESFLTRIIKGWGYFAAAFVMNIWFCTVMLTFAGNSLVVKLLTGIAALIILDGLLFNYSYNAAKSDREQIKYHGEERDKLMPLKMSLIVPAFHYISYIVLCLCKAGIITWDNVNYSFNYYSLLNIHTLPWTAMFTEGRDLAHLTVPGLFGLLLINLTEAATITVTYLCTLNDIDVKKLIMYKGK